MLLINVSGHSPSETSQRYIELQKQSPAAEDQPLHEPSPKADVSRRDAEGGDQKTRRAHNSELARASLCATLTYKMLLRHHRLGVPPSLTAGQQSHAKANRVNRLNVHGALPVNLVSSQARTISIP